MKISIPYRFDRFWSIYFFIRVFYLLFTVFIYSRFTLIGDTERYLNAAISFSPAIFTNSTALMDFLGGITGRILGGNNIVSNFPAMLVSFLTVRWAVEKLGFRKNTNPLLLMAIISLPNFCIWTSVFSKEVIGLVFSAILGVLLVNYLKADYKLRWRDLAGFYLCFLFKPQYLPFILQALVFIRFAALFRKSPITQFAIGLLLILLNLGVLWSVRDTVNKYAEIMPTHFISYEGGANRNENIWDDGNFFSRAPAGMLISFIGPTPAEMIKKPAMMLAGLESIFIIALFLWLTGRMLGRIAGLGRFSPVIIVSYFIVFSGIAFMHYPFGIFNSGAAIRYRTNFIFLFIILLLYLYQRYRAGARYSLPAGVRPYDRPVAVDAPDHHCA